jgi:hypothetical protein
MNIMLPISLIRPLGLLVGFLSVVSAAAAIEVSARVDRREVQAGQPVVVAVQVRNCDAVPTVQPPAVAGATIAPVGGPQARPSLLAGIEPPGQPPRPGGTVPGQGIVGGLRDLLEKMPADALDLNAIKQTGDPKLMQEYQTALAALADLNRNDYTFFYHVYPDRAGNLTVPAFQVTSGNQTASTQPLTLAVSEPRSPHQVRVRVALANPNAVPGEETLLYLDLMVQRGPVVYNGKSYPHLPVKGVHLSIPTLENGPLEYARPLNNLVQEKATPAGQIGYRLNDFATTVMLEHEPKDPGTELLDPQYCRRRLALPVRVRQGGQVQLPPARVSGEVFLTAGLAGNRVAAAGGAGRWEPFVVTSDPVAFAARDLNGRPDRPRDFHGVIGPVTVSAQASQTRMPAGTPFTLTVRVEGRSPLTQALPPDLAARPEFNQQFRVRLEGEKLVSPTVREFSYTLRPLSPDVKEVPAVVVNYYNPSSDRFETTQSQPIPLEVTPAPLVTTPDPVQASTPEPAAAEEVEEEIDPPSPWQRLWSREALPAWLATLPAVALVGGLTFWGARRLWRRERSRKDPGRTVRVPNLLCAPGVTVGEVHQAVQDFLRARFNLPAGEVTPPSAAACLRAAGYDEGLARRCEELLETCAAALFAPGLVNLTPTELALRAEHLLQEITTARCRTAAG